MDLIGIATEQIIQYEGKPACVMVLVPRHRTPRKKKKEYKKLFGVNPKQDMKEVVQQLFKK